MASRKTPTIVELQFPTGRDARDFRRLLAGFERRAGMPATPEQYHEYVLPDAPERTPHFVDMLNATSGKIVRQAAWRQERETSEFEGWQSPAYQRTRNPSEESTVVATATTPSPSATPFEGPAPYRVIVLTMHRRSGPKQLVVECDHREQAIEAAEVERGKQTNRRDNAIVRIDGFRQNAYAPIVQWTFRGEWKREMQ